MFRGEVRVRNRGQGMVGFRNGDRRGVGSRGPGSAGFGRGGSGEGRGGFGVRERGQVRFRNGEGGLGVGVGGRLGLEEKVGGG